MTLVEPRPVTTDSAAPPRWAKVLDQTRCIGCHACTTACKSENAVPVGVTRTYVKSVEVGRFPLVRRAFQVTRCNQCDDAPCVAACPTGAMLTRPDGIVDFDKSICIGCKACMAACPYDAIFINPEDHSAEKCNFCAHRLEIGLEPACVTVCPTEAILVGDMNDPTSKVAQIVQRQPVTVRRHEKGTRPALFYKGAHQATLDPIAARRPDGGLYAWATQGDRSDRQLVPSGHPGTHTSSAAALLSYDVPHRAPWGWRVSLYTWTKGIAAGTLAVAVVLAYLGRLSFSGATVDLAAPSLALAFLAATGVLLIWDLKHPMRFWMIFTRHRWQSWLVRGSFVIGFYGAVVTAFLVVGILGQTGAIGSGATSTAEKFIGGVALSGAVGTACYTAFLFAQAKARDLWQSPLLPPHLAVQSALVGAAALLPFAPGTRSAAALAIEVTVAVAAGLHVLLVVGELTVGHPTAHAHLAAEQMTRGRFAGFFWPGLVLVAASVAAPWIGTAATALALTGLVLHEHAYVQAGQSVPLA
ncbi:MAG: polysulfide reductase NrfD [Actinomycetota bacterium]|nr:polysulfide reductase NrfD [Actinomycetota bacterium]